MVSTRKLRELQKNKDAKKEAKAAKGAQGGQPTTDEIMGANEEMDLNTQRETVGYKRKLNEPTSTVNNQTGTDLTAATTHMGVAGPQIPSMGADANLQQVPPVASMVRAQMETDSLAANQFIVQAAAVQQGALPPPRGRGKQCNK
jgi:hypothetical protein